jgi:hypothetical protein
MKQEDLPIPLETFPLNPKALRPKPILPIVISLLNLFEFLMIISALFYYNILENDCEAAPLMHWVYIFLGLCSLHVLFSSVQETIFKMTDLTENSEKILSLVHSLSLGIMVAWTVMGNFWLFIPGLTCRNTNDFKVAAFNTIACDLLILISIVLSIVIKVVQMKNKGN